MTASELHDLVKHWPREAWPKGIFYQHSDGRRPERWTTSPTDTPGTHDFVNYYHASLMFEASGARWLDEHENHWTSSRFNGGIDIFSACQSTSGVARKLGTGPTRIAAISAAVIVVAKEVK